MGDIRRLTRGRVSDNRGPYLTRGETTGRNPGSRDRPTAGPTPDRRIAAGRWQRTQRRSRPGRFPNGSGGPASRPSSVGPDGLPGFLAAAMAGTTPPLSPTGSIESLPGPGCPRLATKWRQNPSDRHNPSACQNRRLIESVRTVRVERPECAIPTIDAIPATPTTASLFARCEADVADAVGSFARSPTLSAGSLDSFPRFPHLNKAAGFVSSPPRVPVQHSRPPFWQELGFVSRVLTPTWPGLAAITAVLGSFGAAASSLILSAGRSDRNAPSVYPRLKGAMVSESQRHTLACV